MVKKEINNIYDFKSSEEAISYFLQNFKNEFPEFTIKKSYEKLPYSLFSPFEFEYLFKYLTLTIGSERMALGYLLLVNGRVLDFDQIDPNCSKLLAFSKSNLYYFFLVLKIVIESYKINSLLPFKSLY